MKLKATVIRVDGAREPVEVESADRFDRIRKLRALIGAEGLHTVNLRNGFVMMVDDTGLIDGRPVNPEASKLYWAICIPGTTHPICGDVVIVLDKDFE